MKLNETHPLRGPEFNGDGQQRLTTMVRYGLGRPRVLLIIAAALAAGGAILN